MSKVILEAKNLYKNFGSFKAVNDISLSVSEGEVIGLLGPNGAGKTTTIQMLLGVLKPSSGTVSYFGRDFWQYRSEILEKVSFSSTYVTLPWDLTVKEILNYTSYLYKINDRKKRISEIVELFKLKEVLNSPIKELSAGQETRVNLAKAFINDPKVLLLDEPTASLDPDIADYIRKFLIEQKNKHNLSILITSHNMSEVTEVCDRVIFIDHGKIIADDTPENLARSLSNSTLELNFGERVEEAKQFLVKNNYKFEQSESTLSIDIDEYKIPEVLELLIKNNIKYIEINIEKPDLEDYFLHLTRNRGE